MDALALEEADDADDTKEAVISLIVQCAPMGVDSAPQSNAPTRMLASDKEDIRVLVSTRWVDLDPGRSLFEELVANSGIRGRVSGIDSVAADCRVKATELKFGPPLPAGLTEDGLGALVAYTHDKQTGKREGNLYFELNGMLRERGPSPLGPAGLDRLRHTTPLPGTGKVCSPCESLLVVFTYPLLGP